MNKMITAEEKLIEELIKTIQLDIINIPKEDILDLYHSWFQEKGKPVKWIFNKKSICANQFLPLTPYLLGIDFPNWFGDISANKRIMIVGIDPLRNENVFNKHNADKNNDVLIGTPYGLHSSKEKSGTTRTYWEFINSLSQNNFVYLTDIYKTFFYTDKTKKEKSSNFYKKNTSQLSSIKNILEQEITFVNPDLIITLGKESFQKLTEKKCGKLSREVSLNKSCLKNFPNIPILPFVHLSGATRDKNILNFISANNLDTSNIEKRWEYGLAYSKIIENYMSE